MREKVLIIFSDVTQKLSLFLIIFFLTYPTLIAQFNASRIDIITNQYLPKTATLSSVIKPNIDLSTGALNQTIPLLSLPGRFKDINMALNYRGTGITVNEVASYVGLGWELQGGGVIVREVKGVPDEINLMSASENHQMNQAGWLDSVERQVNYWTTFQPGFAISDKTVAEKVQL